eukprot:scaffold29206_cov75-Phaeocystis_antarctica.AAC.3
MRSCRRSSTAPPKDSDVRICLDTARVAMPGGAKLTRAAGATVELQLVAQADAARERTDLRASASHKVLEIIQELAGRVDNGLAGDRLICLEMVRMTRDK